MKHLLPALLGLAACTSVAHQRAPEPSPPITASAGALRPAVTSHRLDNGLEVHLLPDQSAPLVSVQVWVKVGSVDEHEARPGELNGITGLSHFFEHLMFQGTERFPSYDLALAPLGARNNAFTYQDATVYWAYTPKEHLRTILDIEADRFEHMKVDFIHLEPEREVVKSERRQRVDADPAELAEERAIRNTFDVFPYRWGPIGWMTDLDSVSLESAQRYHAQHYRPDNAFLVITGDFDPEVTLGWVRELWGGLEGSRTAPAFGQRSEVQLKVESWTGPRTDHLLLPTSQTTVIWSYRAPASSGPTVRDYASLELIDWALTGGKSGRLSKRLVFAERPLLSNLSARLTPLRFPYAYVWRADLLPEASAREIERALEEELALIARDGLPAEELAEAVASLRADLVRQNLSLSDKGESIGFAIASAGSPYAFHERLALYGELTSNDIAAAARKWLVPELRSRVTVVAPDRIATLVGLTFEGHPQAELAARAVEVFTATIELTARESDLERERKAIALLAQRADLAVSQASREEKEAILTYQRDNEMGTTKRMARAEEQLRLLASSRKDLAANRKAVLAALKKARLDPGAPQARMIELLAADPSGPIEIVEPPTALPVAAEDLGPRMALELVRAFTLEARGFQETAQRHRRAVLQATANPEAVPEGGRALVEMALDLARDTSRENLKLIDRPLTFVRPSGGRR